MSSKTWVYIIILVIVLAAGGIFFWWMYKSSKITPKAETSPSPGAQTFSDVDSTYWAFNEIETVAKAGYMVGYREFKPEGTITRADLATIIGRTYNKTANPNNPSFSDVPSTNAAYQYIEGLKAAGWIEGYPDGTFKPEGLADRATVAVFSASAKAGGKDAVPDPGNIQNPYTDVDPTGTFAWAYKYIIYCNQQNIMMGISQGIFSPGTNSTRAMAAAAVARAAGKVADPAPTTAFFTDVPVGYWAFAEIEGLKAAGGIQGYQPVFKPDDIADRATVAVGVARAMAGSDSAVPAGPATPSYSDVPTDFWAYKYIEYLKTQNVMVGYEGGTFKPEDKALRYTMAIVIARAKGLDLTSIPTTPSFADVPVTHEAYKEIEAIYKAGYTRSCGTDPTSGKPKFCPGENLSRASEAVFICRAYLCGPFINNSPSAPTSPKVSPSTVLSPSPTPTTTPTLTPTPTPAASQAAVTTTTTPTTTAKTGAELPLAGGGALGLLFLVRYLVGKRIK